MATRLFKWASASMGLLPPPPETFMWCKKVVLILVHYMETRLFGWTRASTELLGPRKRLYVAHEMVVLFVAYFEGRLCGWERPFTELLGLRKSRHVTYGSTQKFPMWIQRFWVGKSLYGAFWFQK